uniref:FLYWCH-type domain-containing protein n=1 Tax=Panagrolaimus sp. ES5 TaxID=591445 RepID=A0AC34F5Q4_9BILA
MRSIQKNRSSQSFGISSLSNAHANSHANSFLSDCNVRANYITAVCKQGGNNIQDVTDEPEVSANRMEDAVGMPEYRFGTNPITGTDALFIEEHRFDLIKQNVGDKKRHWKCQYQSRESCRGNAKTSENGQLLLNDPSWNRYHSCGFILKSDKGEGTKAIRPPRSQSMGPSKTKSTSNIGNSLSVSGSGSENNSHNKVQANHNLTATNVGQITHSPQKTTIYKLSIN